MATKRKTSFSFPNSKFSKQTLSLQKAKNTGSGPSERSKTNIIKDCQ